MAQKRVINAQILGCDVELDGEELLFQLKLMTAGDKPTLSIKSYDCANELMTLLGVQRWSELQGKYIRVHLDTSSTLTPVPVQILHIVHERSMVVRHLADWLAFEL